MKKQIIAVALVATIVLLSSCGNVKKEVKKTMSGTTTVINIVKSSTGTNVTSTGTNVTTSTGLAR